MESWIKAPPEKEYKISEETARSEIQKLLDFYEADFSAYAPDRQTALAEICEILCKAFRRGALELKEADDGIHVIQHFKSGNDLEYKPFTGKVKAKLDSAGDAIYGKIYRCLGSLSGLGEDVFFKLKGGDLKTSEAVGSLFLAL
jgi:hypothetical protein